MKYFVMGKPGITPMPPEQLVGLNQAAKAWMEERFEDGSVECHYVFPDGGGFSVANMESHEALLDTLLDYPLYPIMDWEIKVLCEWDHGYDKFIEFWRKLAG